MFCQIFFDGRGGNVDDRLCLNPFSEVFHCHNGESVIALCRSEFANNVDAPPLQGPRWGNQLRRLCWGFGAMQELLTVFAGCYQFCCVIDHCWPVKPLPEDFGC
jgi:hypothetical protein